MATQIHIELDTILRNMDYEPFSFKDFYAQTDRPEPTVRRFINKCIDDGLLVKLAHGTYQKTFRGFDGNDLEEDLKALVGKYNIVEFSTNGEKETGLMDVIYVLQTILNKKGER